MIIELTEFSIVFVFDTEEIFLNVYSWIRTWQSPKPKIPVYIFAADSMSLAAVAQFDSISFWEKN